MQNRTLKSIHIERVSNEISITDCYSTLKDKIKFISSPYSREKNFKLTKFLSNSERPTLTLDSLIEFSVFIEATTMVYIRFDISTKFWMSKLNGIRNENRKKKSCWIIISFKSFFSSFSTVAAFSLNIQSRIRLCRRCHGTEKQRKCLKLRGKLTHKQLIHLYSTPYC